MDTGPANTSRSARQGRRSRSLAAAIVAAGVVVASPGRADGLSDDQIWRYRSSDVAVDAGVVATTPAPR